MEQNKEYRKDLWLFLGSVIVLLFILFTNYVHVNNWDNEVLLKMIDILTFPMIIIGSIVPLIVVYRFMIKKTQSRTLSMLTLFFSLFTAVIMGYTSF
ncbi:hypothetical protein M0G43_08065 [Subsaxibacter sp. CAU 1640]|uniref:hypothetical protein n=1 Tax=Subsaxibacter sp. CAU 1640 TaxID=2933271 RepID=UPI0020047F5C|nr:hypothetical protein [Subsaxibacter sp. CAU 1640]MCK7590523.1 hypothetical protein [Subsaxibacter sp. CAU 1640]